MQPPKLLIFDGNNLFYRSFHGNEKLTNADGTPTGAVYGFIVTMQGLLDQFPGYQPVFVFDPFPDTVFPAGGLTAKSGKPLLSTVPDLDTAGRKTRKELYPAYKANRSPMPDELQAQVVPLLLVLNAMGHPVICGNSVLEADDVIGTLAAEAPRRGGRAVVGTTDKDIAAMVNDNCLLYNFALKKVLDHNGVVEKYGVSPDKIAGWLALMGDTSDNVPGVFKCGEKTAAKWMNTYGTLDNVIANAADIKGVVGDNLRAAVPTLPLAYSLTLLRTDTPVAFDVCTTAGERDEHFLRHLYQGLGFQKFLRQLDSAPARDTTPELV